MFNRFILKTLLVFILVVNFPICLLAASPGDQLWNATLSGDVKSSPTIGSDGTIYIGTNNNYLYALYSNGTQKWNATLSSSVRSPSIGEDGTIYVGTSNGILYAIYPNNGTQKWNATLSSYIEYSSPAIGRDETIYVGTFNWVNGYLYAYYSNGTQKWNATLRDGVFSSPAIGGDETIYVGTDDGYGSGHLYAFYSNGTQRWNATLRGDVFSSPSIGKSGTIYIGTYGWSNPSYLYAFYSNGTQQWNATLNGSVYYSSPAIGADGTIYIGTDTGNLYAFYPENGTQKWNATLRGDVYSSPAIGDDGTIYVGTYISSSNTGYFYALSSSGTQQWNATLRGKVEVSSTAIENDGTIYIGTDAGYLYAYYSNSTGPANSPWPMFQHDVRHTGRQLYYTLDVIVGSGSGGVSKSPDLANYTAGTEVTLSANPASGYVFDHWEGDCSGTSYTCILTMEGDKSVEVYFKSSTPPSPSPSPPPPSSYGYRISVNVIPAEGGTTVKSPEQTRYSYGTTVTLSAQPKAGYVFDHWGGDCEGNSTTCTLTMYGNKGVNVYFKLASYVISLNTIPANGGSISKSPDNSTYDYGTNVTLSAQPSAGYVFDHWGGDCEGNSTACTLTINGNKRVETYFTLSSISGTLKWIYSIGGAIVSSLAIGNDGTIYVSSLDGNIYAIDSESGSLKWIYQTGSVIISSPAVGEDGSVYFGANNSKIYALNQNGSLKWEYGTGNKVTSSPAIANDGTVYVGSDNGKLYAINPDGSLKWRYQTERLIISSVAIGNDGTIYVGSNDGKLYALNSDRSLKWWYQTGGAINSSPAISYNGSVYIGSKDNSFYALNSNGSLKWRYDGIGDGIISSPTIDLIGSIYFGANNGKIYALSSDGSLKWEYETGDQVVSSPAIGDNGIIYIGSNDGNLYAINSSSGTLEWTYPTGSAVISSPVLGDNGTIYIGTLDGNIYAIYSNSTGPANSAWPMFGHDPRRTGQAQGGITPPSPVRIWIKVDGARHSEQRVRTNQNNYVEIGLPVELPDSDIEYNVYCAVILENGTILFKVNDMLHPFVLYAGGDFPLYSREQGGRSPVCNFYQGRLTGVTGELLFYVGYSPANDPLAQSLVLTPDSPYILEVR